MHELLANRMEQLQREYQVGQQRLHTLQTEAAELRDTLLRIEGAMQLAREMLQDSSSPSTPVLADHSPDGLSRDT
jgi:hypothetical protein